MIIFHIAERIFDQFTNIKAYFTGVLYPGQDLDREPMRWLVVGYNLKLIIFATCFIIMHP